MSLDKGRPHRDSFAKYAVVGSTGHRNGFGKLSSRCSEARGFRGRVLSLRAIQPFRDETVTAYEVGMKSRVLPNLQINTAAFDYEYRDAQFYGPLCEPPVSTLFDVANAGNARVRRLEGDIRWRPTAGLDLHGGVGFIDTKITKSIVAGVAEGNRIPNAPQLTLNGSIRYGCKVSDQLRADVTLSGANRARLRSISCAIRLKLSSRGIS